jgi:hypothetical protein
MVLPLNLVPNSTPVYTLKRVKVRKCPDLVIICLKNYEFDHFASCLRIASSSLRWALLVLG